MFSDSPEIAATFDPILFSFQLGAVKPEHELFERATRRLGAEPGEITFVDDQPGHVAAARSAGWDAILYESPSRLRAALRERGVVG